MTKITGSFNPFKRSANYDRKLALLRRADTERDTTHSIGGVPRKQSRLASGNKPSLARVPTMEKQDDDEQADPLPRL
jgi:hypothetical protein